MSGYESMREMVRKTLVLIIATLAPFEDINKGAVYRDREDCLTRDTDWLISRFIPLLLIIDARGRRSKKNIPASLDFIDDCLELATGKRPLLLLGTFLLGLVACFHDVPRG